jgi:hypothetical protein
MGIKGAVSYIDGMISCKNILIIVMSKHIPTGGRTKKGKYSTKISRINILVKLMIYGIDLVGNINLWFIVI